MEINIPKHFPLIFFLLYLLLGIYILPDYGFSWDEATERDHAEIYLDYVNKQFGGALYDGRLNEKISFEEYTDKHHGVLFSISCYVISELGLEITSFRDIYLFRHYGVFILFWLSTIFYYKILLERFKSQSLALLGIIFLILTPRIFAHSFFNSKDIVLLSFYTIATFSLIRFLKTPNIKWALLHGFCTALIMSVRIVGIIMPVLSICFFILIWISKKEKISVLKEFTYLLLYCLIAWLFTVCFNPFLWEKPIMGLIEMFQVMSKFHWGGHILLWGEYHAAQDLPWFYIPSWMLISLPIIYILLHFTGIFYFFKQVLSNLKQYKFYTTEEELYDLLFFCLYFAPLFAVIYKHSVLYDGWRHLFFIYPCFLIFVLQGFIFIRSKLFSKQRKLHFLYTPICINLLFVLSFMIKEHPHQHVYFNYIADHDDLRKRFELDYWGLGYKAALEEILRRDDRAEIKVKAVTYPGVGNVDFLPPHHRKRIKLVWHVQIADYTLLQYRFLGNWKQVLRKEYPFDQEFFTIDVNRTPIIGVYKTNLLSKGKGFLHSRE